MDYPDSTLTRDPQNASIGLLVAGDMADTYDNFVLTMSLLKEKFQHVFFVHVTMIFGSDGKNDYLGSLDKLDKLLEACQRIGLETKPSIVDDLVLIHCTLAITSFDEEKDIAGVRIPSLQMVINFLLLACTDYYVCRWPDGFQNGDTSLTTYFDSLNDEN